MSSDSDSGDDRKLPAAYAKRRRRQDSSSDSNDSDDGRRRDKRQSRPSKKEDDRRRNARKKEKKDRPMWKEEGEISGESDNESSSFSSSSSRSRSRDRRRRRQRRHSIDRRQPRRREAVKKQSHKCNDCGCSHFSLKAHIHHQLHDHNLGAQCHLCQKKFETQKAIQEHYELDHTQEIVKCNFCKSPFDQPLEMKGVKWDEYFSHLYGEIFYSRLAEYEERGHG
ncbi:hypothetical protein CAEBREN_03523 [Caenorhabditis brenneri]|uniref:C2H2-type domain-containing protein n=1 Tax=Caenorhabditis brenneri TaxID=135651 RepID=G0MG89_CAEBE|nr:hypothetical protein CAEBREN_03523 [Caenorhabditis brenneri]